METSNTSNKFKLIHDPREIQEAFSQEEDESEIYAFDGRIYFFGESSIERQGDPAFAITGGLYCPQCGEDCEELHEGYCQDCCESNQSALDAHNRRYDEWKAMSIHDRNEAIKQAMENNNDHSS